jgi:hypothetical protein
MEHQEQNGDREEVPFFLIKEAFIRTSEAIHQVDTKPKRATSGLCLT